MAQSYKGNQIEQGNRVKNTDVSEFAKLIQLGQKVWLPLLLTGSLVAVGFVGQQSFDDFNQTYQENFVKESQTIALPSAQAVQTQIAAIEALIDQQTQLRKRLDASVNELVDLGPERVLIHDSGTLMDRHDSLLDDYKKRLQQYQSYQEYYNEYQERLASIDKKRYKDWVFLSPKKASWLAQSWEKLQSTQAADTAKLSALGAVMSALADPLADDKEILLSKAKQLVQSQSIENFEQLFLKNTALFNRWDEQINIDKASALKHEDKVYQQTIERLDQVQISAYNNAKTPSSGGNSNNSGHNQSNASTDPQSSSHSSNEALVGLSSSEQIKQALQEARQKHESAVESINKAASSEQQSAFNWMLNLRVHAQNIRDQWPALKEKVKNQQTLTPTEASALSAWVVMEQWEKAGHPLMQRLNKNKASTDAKLAKGVDQGTNSKAPNVNDFIAGTYLTMQLGLSPWDAYGIQVLNMRFDDDDELLDLLIKNYQQAPGQSQQANEDLNQQSAGIESNKEASELISSLSAEGASVEPLKAQNQKEEQHHTHSNALLYYMLLTQSSHASSSAFHNQSVARSSFKSYESHVPSLANHAVSHSSSEGKSMRSSGNYTRINPSVGRSFSGSSFGG